MEKETPEENEQEEFQQIATELREAQQRIEALERQTEVINNSINEIENTTETVKGMEEMKSGTEILVPIGSGSYVTAEVKNPDRILSNLGADLVAERKPEEVTKLLEKQKKDFENSLQQTQEKIEELKDKIEELRPKAQELMAKAQGEQKTPSE